jgi:LuxR family maltose regulon positive regulatory protein
VYISGDFDALQDSVRSSLEKDDPAAAIQAIVRAWPSVSTTHGAGLRRLIESIPHSAWSDDPWILAAMGASYRSLDSTSRSAAIPYFRTAEALMAADPGTRLSLKAGVRLHFAAALRSLGRFDDALATATSAAELLDDELQLSPLVRVRVQAKIALQLGIVKIHLGDYSGAIIDLRLAYGLREQNLLLSETVECLAGLSFLKYVAGEFAAGREYARRAREASGTSGLVTSRFGAVAVITETLLAVEQNRLADALAASTEAVPAAFRSDWEALALYAQAAISVISGRHIEGLELIRRSLDIAREWQGDVTVRTMCEGLRGGFFMHLGELDTAARVISELRPTQNHANCPARFIAGMRFTSGDAAGVLEALAECEALGDAHSGRTMVDVLLLKAAANYDLGTTVVADVALDRAMLFAAQNGIRTPFLLIPPTTMQRMLGRASDRNQPPQVHTLLEELRKGRGAPLHGPFEPLSDRELDIAHHLALDKTIGQIAAELYISSNTVKTHVRSIYRKLSASNRKEAVRRVRELGLQLEITRS